MNSRQMQLILTVVLLFAALPAQAREADTWAAAYEQLTGWKFSTEAVALPAEGITLNNDTAEWILESGTVRLMQPISDGTVTGLVFEGQGRFRMAVPDPVEVAQLSRFTGAKRNDSLEFTFSRMVLRTTDSRVVDLFPPVSAGSFKKNSLARQRHCWWLERARFDADSRVISGLLNGDGEYLAVDMETDEYGWLFYEFDPWRMEEIRLCRMRKSFDFVEIWVSLDRAEHRRPDGRPGSEHLQQIDLLHADLEVDLMKHKGRAGLEISRKSHPRENPKTSFRTRMVFESQVDGLQAVPLRLHPRSRDVTATDSAGRPLPVLRAPLGRLFLMIDRKDEDCSLVVILHQPLARGESVTIDFSWQRQNSNGPGAYVTWFGAWYPPFGPRAGRYWYPVPLGERDDPHTAKVTITHPKKLGVRATGVPSGGSRDGSRVIDVWESDGPLKAAAYSYGHGYKERRILREGQPEVISFGANRVQQMGDTVEAVAAHMADSIQLYQHIFDYPLPMKTVTGVRVSNITQSYSGFIGYGRGTFDFRRTWESERSLASETAELFWYGQLDWESYRDRWLFGALARYSAMMYLEVVTEGWGRGQKGSIESYQEYLRLRQRWLVYGHTERHERLGPLNVGFRAPVPEFNSSYNTGKGLAVLHMLRGILRNRFDDNDQRFFAILADFLKTHTGGTASTRDFIAAVERNTGEDWGWFFDQWVYVAGVPIYGWSHTLAAEPDDDGLYRLDISMKQRGVPEGFRMPVTFGLEYGDAEPELLHFEMDQPSKTHTVRLPFRPVKVTFDPHYDLLYVKEYWTPGGSARGGGETE